MCLMKPFKKFITEMALDWKEIPQEQRDEAEAIIDDHNKGAKSVSETGGLYYIGVTGKEQVFYTLWRQPFFTKGSRLFENRPIYMGKLRTDLVPSMKEAVKKVPKNVRIEIDTEGTRKHIIGSKDQHIFRFGKYKGRHIGEVYLEDPQYIAYLVNLQEKDPFYNPNEFDKLMKEFRDLYYIETEKKNLEQSKSQFIGKPGDKFEGMLEIYSLRTKQGQGFGYRAQPQTYTTYKLKDQDDNKFLANNIHEKTDPPSSDSAFKVGDKVKIQGKIKEHIQLLGVKFNKISYIKKCEKVQ